MVGPYDTPNRDWDDEGARESGDGDTGGEDSADSGSDSD